MNGSRPIAWTIPKQVTSLARQGITDHLNREQHLGVLTCSIIVHKSFDRMLEYCYNHDYTEAAIEEENEPESQWTSQVLVNAEVYTVAVGLHMKDLQYKGKGKLSEALFEDWVEILKMSPNEENLASTIENILKATVFVYKGAERKDDSLRTPLVPFAQRNWRLFTRCQGLPALIKEYHQFVTDVLMSDGDLLEAGVGLRILKFTRNAGKEQVGSPDWFICVGCKHPLLTTGEGSWK